MKVLDVIKKIKNRIIYGKPHILLAPHQMKNMRGEAYFGIKDIKTRLEFYNDSIECYALNVQEECPYQNEECSNCTQGFPNGNRS